MYLLLLLLLLLFQLPHKEVTNSGRDLIVLDGLLLSTTNISLSHLATAFGAMAQSTFALLRSSTPASRPSWICSLILVIGKCLSGKDTTTHNYIKTEFKLGILRS